MEDGSDVLSYHRPNSRPFAILVRVAILACLLAGILFIGMVVFIFITVGTPRQKTVARAVEATSGASAEWVQLSRLIDHNYRLRIQLPGATTISTVFESPDEGPDDGRTALLWSRDGTRVLVLMTYVGTRPSTPELTDGRKVYLLHDLRDGSVRCNASQTTAPPIAVSDLADFSLPVALAVPSSQNASQ